MPSTIERSAATSPDLSPLETSDCPEARPELLHSLKHGSTVLALAVSPEHDCIYSGTQDGEIVSWSLATFHQLQAVQAHKRSVLSLFLSPDSSLLFSSAGDPIINVWCPKTLQRLYEIYGVYDVGDIFCTAYSAQYETLYIGAQNATIQWINLRGRSSRQTPDPQQHPDRRNHRFFDSKAVGGVSTPRRNDDRWGLIPQAQRLLQIDNTSVRNFAHNGYVYCMLMAKSPTVQVDADDEVLISGGGDGTIKLWSLGKNSDDLAADEPTGQGAICEIMTLGEDDAESVLSLTRDGSFLYAGKLDGIIELWDLDTAQKLRVLKAHEHDIMSIQMGWGCLWTGSSDGWVTVSTFWPSIRAVNDEAETHKDYRNTVLFTTALTSTSLSLSVKSTSA
jgi:di- and tripeptidase